LKTFLIIIAISFACLIIGLWLASFIISQNIERNFPPIGEFKTINGAKLHYLDTGEVADKTKPAIIFIHGAGGNILDQMHIYRPLLEADFRLVFPDRPGQGYSEPFASSNDPIEQANSIAILMDELGIKKAIISGHSFGGVVTAAFGVLYPEKTAGLIFLAPVTHPWHTGVDWHYNVGNTPVIGWLFSRLIAVPAGNKIYPAAIKQLFSPNKLPQDYAEKSGTRLALRPSAFHENAKDVARVHDHVEKFHTRYKEIKAPTYIFHGDKDDIVSLEIHSINGLSKDIEGAKLEILQGVGHKPDYIASDKVVAAIREIAAK